MFGAAAHALAIGLPLNRHITLHLEAAGIADEHAARIIGDMLKRWRDWVCYHGGGFAALWVRETGARKGIARTRRPSRR